VSTVEGLRFVPAPFTEPAALIELLLVPVFAAHLLAVNVASGGPLVCMWLERRETRRDDQLAGQTGRYLARQSMVMLTVGIVLGLLMTWLIWIGGDHRFFETFLGNEWLIRKLWWGVAELVFFYACMAAYLRWWQGLARWRSMHRLLAILAATNLLYHFPTLFSVLTTVNLHPTLLEEGQAIDRAAFLSLMGSVQVLSMVAHFLLASVAVVGMLMMGYALRLIRQGADPADAARIARYGGRFALVPTVVQLLIGLYVLFHLPRYSQGLLLGGDLLGTAMLAASVLASIWLMHLLATVSLGEAERGPIIRSMTLLVLIVVLMTSTLQRAKHRTYEHLDGDQPVAQSDRD